MKERKQLIIRGIICIAIVVVELLVYFGISKHIANEKEKNEFLRTIDCAEIFDAYPGCSFEVKFEIRAKKPGQVLVYQQNGDSRRYFFAETIDVTEEFKEVSLTITPVLENDSIEEAYLSFYGQYGSGVIPTVRNISILPIGE